MRRACINLMNYPEAEPRGIKPMRRINVPDIKYSFTFVKQDIEDKWEWYKEQYIEFCNIFIFSKIISVLCPFSIYF